MENVDFSLDVWKKADIITVFVCFCLFLWIKGRFFQKMWKTPEIPKGNFKKRLTRVATYNIINHCDIVCKRISQSPVMAFYYNAMKISKEVNP